MHGQELFQDAFVYLLAAVISVPIAKRLGFGSVLGYLIAGIAIGPFGLGLVGDAKDVMHFAEFGVVLMLFLIGLELDPQMLWRLRAPIVGLGGLQVLITGAALAAVAAVVGQPWQAAIAIGLVLALSSTAIVLQTLSEKGLTRTAGGQSAFSVLLFQDIAVIPLLALLPLLATGATVSAGAEYHDSGALTSLPGWAQTLIVLGAVAAIVVGGRLLVGPAFRMIARTKLRELFTAAALLLVIGIALLMAQVGLSPALGTFLAGVVLANSEYRHELESDIAPFKGLLLGLFFLAVGSSIDFGLIADEPAAIFTLVGVLIVVKLLVLAVLGKAFGLSLDQNLLFSFGLAQSGEFAFVLFSFAVQEGVLEEAVTAPLIAVVAISMALTPLLLLLSEKVLMPRFGTRERPAAEADEMHEDSPVIIAGFGRFGQVVERLLVANGIRCTVLDDDSDQVDLLRRFGHKVFYGDVTRVDLLEAAGAHRARLLVLAVDQPERTMELVRIARKHFPHLKLLARVRGRRQAYDLIEAKVDHVFRETFDSALALGTQALQELGFRAYRAQRAARAFRRHDEALVRELAGRHRDQKEYINLARRRIEVLEQTLRADLTGADGEPRDTGWDTESLRAEFGGEAEKERPDG